MYIAGSTIKNIMDKTGIRSEQTVYRILDDLKIARRSKFCPLKKTISFEEDVAPYVEKAENASAFVCECIREAVKKYHLRETNSDGSQSQGAGKTD